MTKQDYTYIGLILDRSGSMASIKEDMEGALNTFIEDQKKVPGRCDVSLVQFDDVVENVFLHKPLYDVQKIVLTPRNMTALYDAIGKTINTLGEYFKRLPEDQRPEKVLIVTITDGHENHSREFSHSQIKDMITHQTDKYGWQFTFIGANQDAIMTGTGLGVDRTKGLTFGANKGGTQAVGMSLSSATTRFRGSPVGSSYGYTSEEQEEAEKTASS